MRLRVGLISSQRTDAMQLRKEFDGLNVVHAETPVDLVPAAGSGQRLDGIVILGDKFISECGNIFNFLHAKPQFKTTPMVILTTGPAIFPNPISSPLIRTFTTHNGMMLPLVSFFDSLQKPGSFLEMMKTEKLGELFSQALTKSISTAPEYDCSVATDDEIHSEYLCQLSDEVSTHLLWIKFAARILREGSDGLLTLSKGMGEAQSNEFLENILQLAIKEFTQGLWQALRDDGALRFKSSLELPAAVKLPYLKGVKNSALVFKSSACNVLLELSRYI